MYLGLCTLVFFSTSAMTASHGHTPRVREYGSAEAYSRAVSNAGSAPGTYVKYDWPNRPPSPSATLRSLDMEVDHVWTTIPADSQTDGNGVFASSQFWHTDRNGTTIAGGYMGSQVMRRGNGSERRVFIFSCWDVPGYAKVGWTTPETCMRFGGEGVGSHCVLDYPVVQGRLYNFRFVLSGSNATGAMWSGTVTDTVTGESRLVGTLFYPHVWGNIGFGTLKVTTNEFLEYFEGGDCDGAVHVGVGTFGPYFRNRTITASQAYPAYGTGACNRTEVTDSIPGHGAGFPRVFVQGGKGVERNNSDKTALWSHVPPGDDMLASAILV